MKKLLTIFLLIAYCTWSAPFTITAIAVDEVDMENAQAVAATAIENEDTETASTETASTETASTETASTETASTETASTETASTETANTEVATEESVTNKTELDLSAKSVVLMEASTGTVIYEKEAHMQLAPASVTKVMTLLLIFEALDEGKITLDEEVVVSEYAASMGGSQVYLEPGERQTVDTMIKCITVSSANDACVAMAEHVAGSEAEFVNRMNTRAKDLGMNNTHFINCNGLDADGHLTTAYDIALMSAELMHNYPEIEDYTMIWMENITHTTSKGTSEFGLSNTNKLVRYYEYATGLKTGYTSTAGSCISATARKNGIDMIAVVMGAPASADRNADAVKLLDHGFANCQRYTDNDKITLEEVSVLGGMEETVTGEIAEPFSYVDITGENLDTIEKTITYSEDLEAPVAMGDIIGTVEYSLNGTKVGESKITATCDIEAMDFTGAIWKVMGAFVM